MSHFYADIQGSRGAATRQGGKTSGINGHIRGWHIGARIACYVNAEGKDTCSITLTSGSAGMKCEKPLGIFTAKDL